jgi:hypothetical protein
MYIEMTESGLISQSLLPDLGNENKTDQSARFAHISEEM